VTIAIAGMATAARIVAERRSPRDPSRVTRGTEMSVTAATYTATPLLAGAVSTTSTTAGSIMAMPTTGWTMIAASIASAPAGTAYHQPIASGPVSREIPATKAA